jgi:hypothetical protein
MTPEERAFYLKHLAATLSMAPVLLSGPLADVYFDDGWLWMWPLLIVGPMILLLRGARAMLFAEEVMAKPRVIAYGAVTAVASLVFAPEALRLALVNFSLRPSWVVWTSISTAIALAYLWLAIRRWRTGGRSPNKSLERTRGR